MDLLNIASVGKQASLFCNVKDIEHYPVDVWRPRAYYNVHYAFAVSVVDSLGRRRFVVKEKKFPVFPNNFLKVIAKLYFNLVSRRLSFYYVTECADVGLGSPVPPPPVRVGGRTWFEHLAKKSGGAICGPQKPALVARDRAVKIIIES